jgi:hypothetical protein
MTCRTVRGRPYTGSSPRTSNAQVSGVGPERNGVEAFLSVAQHRSFRRAAAELGVTPSAVSQAVRALEARVGSALFIALHPHNAQVRLTEAGEGFLSPKARLRGACRRKRGRASASLGTARGLLIASFAKAYPEIKVEIAREREAGRPRGHQTGRPIALGIAKASRDPPTT